MRNILQLPDGQHNPLCSDGGERTIHDGPEAEEAFSEQTMTTLQHHTETIILVDRDESVHTAFRALFPEERFRVVPFTNGIDALAFLHWNPAGIVLCDLRLPDMEGSEFLRSVARVSPESVRIVLCTEQQRNSVVRMIADGTARDAILKPWKPNAVREAIASTVAVLHMVRSARMQRIVSTFTNIPSTASFTRDTIDLARSDAPPVPVLVERIENNPVLLTTVLRVANSAFFGARHHIQDIREAVLFIGSDYLSGLLLSIATFHRLSSVHTGIDRHAMDDLWHRSLLRAHRARTIAENAPHRNSPRLLYIASLLQDIGMVVQIASSGPEFTRFRTLCAAGIDPIVIEQRFFGDTHDAVGALLLRSWNFPEEIATLVEQHHALDISGDSDLTILQAADITTEDAGTVRHDPSIDDRVEEWRTAFQWARPELSGR